MAWEDITYKCGHEGREQLYGPAKDRISKKAWLEGQLCPECKSAVRKEEIKKAEAEAEAAHWAKLKGSEKQLAWALRLRPEMLHKIRKYQNGDLIAKWLAENVTEAAQWIDHEANPRLLAVAHKDAIIRYISQQTTQR